MKITHQKLSAYLSVFCCLSAIAFLTFGVSRAQQKKSKDEKTAALKNDAPRYVHEPDLKQLLPRFLTAQGFIDPRFVEAIAKPSAYLTDFYGIQALADFTREEIKRDFVPRYAEIASEDENSLTLKFKNGYTGKFYPHSLLKVMGTETPIDHVEISGATWRELLKNLEDFRGIIRSNKWEKRYLIPNPFYKDELVVAKNYYGNVKPAEVTVDPTLAGIETKKNAVVIYPEGLHGSVEGYNELKQNVLDKFQFDWIGMEMLSPTQQKDLNAFSQSAPGTTQYNQARQALINYFATAWNGRAGPKTTGEENYYFKIVDQMRSKGARVYGIEGDIRREGSALPYLLFRYGENDFGAAVRSLLWAQNVPKKGRGLVFGGSGHFTNYRPTNFQDFLKLLNPTVKIYAVKPLKMRQPAN